MGRLCLFGPFCRAALALLALPLLPAAAQPVQTELPGDLIARPVERAPLEIERGIPSGLHGLLRGGASAFLRSAGDEHVGALDYAVAAGLLYQFTPSVGTALEQHVASYPAAGDLSYNASVLVVQLGLPARRVTPVLSLGVRSAWGDNIDQVGAWVGLGLDWKINRHTAVTPMLGTSLVDAASGIAGLTTLGAGVRVQLYEARRPALVSHVSYPDTLWRDEPAVLTATLDSTATPPSRIQWRFSDGAIAEGETVRHTFPRPGPHRIELTTFNRAGRADAALIVEVFDRRVEEEKRRAIRRAAGDDERAPLNARIIGARELEVGEFENYRVRIAPQTRRPLNYRWDMGDGTIAEGNNVAHAYDGPGQYVITVNISNDFGEAVYEALVSVQAPSAAEPAPALPPPPPPRPLDDAGDDRPAPPYPRSALYSSTGIDWNAGGFTILVATRLDRASAESIALGHHRAGYRTGIMVDDDEAGGSPAYRVILGQFATLPAATAALRTVQANGLNGIITDITR